MRHLFKRHRNAIVWAVVITFLISGVGLIGLEQAGIFDRREPVDGLPTVAAEVNRGRILREDLDQASANLTNQYIQFHRQMGMETGDLFTGASGALLRLQLRAQALQGLIRQEIFAQQAEERNIRVPGSDIDAGFSEQYDGILARFNITEERLTEFLIGRGATLAQFKEDIRTNVEAQLRDQALREAVIGEISPTDEELEAYLAENIANYETPEEVRASHILVENEETAQEMLVLLAAGSDFAELATEHSTCPSAAREGDLSWFTRGRMVPEFDAAAFALAVGETSGIVTTQFGYHIIKLTDRKPAHTPALVEIKDRVRDDYISGAGDRRFDDWYAGVSAQAQIEIHLPLVAAVIAQQEDLALGLAAFVAVKEEGTSPDPYLPYYIGRIYELKMIAAIEEKGILEGKDDLSEEEIARVAELEQKIAAYKYRALTLYMETLAEIEPDERFIDRILTLDPGNVLAIYRGGRFLLEQGNLFEAHIRFQDAISKDPSFVAAYIASGDVAVELGMFRLAADQYRAALDLRPGSISLMGKLAAVYLTLDRLGEAEQLLIELEQISPENLRLLIVQGDLALKRMKAAIDERNLLTEKSDRTPEEEERLNALAGEITAYKERASERYDMAIARGGSIDLFISMGRTYLMVGELEAAKEKFQHVIRRSPHNAEAYVGRAEVLFLQGDIAGAIADYELAFTLSRDTVRKRELGERLVELDPDNIEMRFRLAAIYAEMFIWSAAIRQYAAILELQPESLEAHLNIAEAYRWRTEYDIAIEYLNRAIALAPDVDGKVEIYETIVEISRLQAGRGQPLRATGLDALFELASLHLAAGAEERARERLEEIVQDDPAHRTDEVNVLLLQAGGVVQTPPVTVAPPQTPSETAEPSESDGP